ncbi:GNAT family N-acetyltransferase [Sanguibacter hominis ATCC BAA-789]|uniref:GNAT family N-acetyltransferase n=1 Tax=Sanguibacter hominis ATCC BAA-789 TaxID=1312740 RepID=A0A9X5FBK5_9MICO|nr:GNAT family N-acetyltransferase [Sanguibacter hominis ATCC BAA-789]
MVRAVIDVRHAGATDLLDVALLCSAAREETATPSQICSADVEKLRKHLGVLLSVPGGRVLLATHDSNPVGFLLARVIEANVYNDAPVLYIEAVYVDGTFRRRGVGHALLSAAAEIAVAAGAEEVYSVPVPGSRGVQRFLARMGFAPAAAHRVVQTSALLRKLGPEGSLRRPPRALEDLIARRRKARIETQSGPVDLRELRARLGEESSPARSARGRRVAGTGGIPHAG